MSDDSWEDRDLAAALHEVGNGLTVVLGWLEQARADSASRDPALVARAVDLAIARARRAHRIARRAIGADISRPAPEPLDAVVAECIHGLEPLAAKRAVSLGSQIAEAAGGLNVEAAELLVQVLTNLLLNGIDATPEGGAVTLGVSFEDPGTVRLEVSDGGPGIPDADRERVFQRGHSGRTGGAGIGLAHTLRVTTEEGGRLSLEPFVAGSGATFRLSWPTMPVTSAATASAPGPRTRRAVSLSDCRVAVVDDDRGIIDLLEMVLSARGAAVTSFTTHDELVARLEKESFDVALLDASPYGAALEKNLATLKRNHPELDLILISGAADPGVSVSRLGVTWIRKPFEVEDVIDVVRLVRAKTRSDT